MRRKNEAMRGNYQRRSLRYPMAKNDWRCHQHAGWTPPLEENLYAPEAVAIAAEVIRKMREEVNENAERKGNLGLSTS